MTDEVLPKINVLILDNQVLVSESIGEALESAGSFICKTATSLREALIATEEDAYDLILMNVDIPEIHGIESIGRFVDRKAKSKVVLLSSGMDLRFLLGCLKVGVFGYIDKTMSIRSTINALHLIESGEVFVPSVFEEIFSEYGRDQSAIELNRFEIDILKMVSQGWTNKKIAEYKNMSEANVKSYMRTICKKLGASNRTQAAIMAKKLVLI